MYYTPVSLGEEELTLMRRLDELHLLYPFMGSRKLRDVLCNEGIKINRKRVQRLMQKMGITAIYPKPNTSKPNVAHTTYPYLLNGLSITHANPVWCADITYTQWPKDLSTWSPSWTCNPPEK